MKKELKRFSGVFVLGLITVFLVGGCFNSDDEELNRQIQEQVNLIEREVKAVEQHQQTMRGMIKEMRGQINAMNEELNKESPRIHAAGGAISYLRQLTTVGFGESPGHWTMRNPAWSAIWVILFVLIIWLLYRIRARNGG